MSSKEMMNSTSGSSSSRKHLIFVISMAVALSASRASAQTSNSSLHLDNTVRVDPLDNLRKYREGYDVTNEHYWSSTAFTGVSGYAISAAWLMCGLGYGVYLLVRKSFKKNRKPKKIVPCHKNCRLKPLVIAIVFTVLAILGVGLVLGGNAKFHSRAKTVIDIVIDTADEASDTIRNTTQAMKEMNITLGNETLGTESSDTRATRFLTRTSRALDDQAANISRQASKNRRLINRGLNIVYVFFSFILLFIFTPQINECVWCIEILEESSSINRALLDTHCPLLAVLRHIPLPTKVHFFANDTCTAFESFQQNPYNNSLSSILPCDELLSARAVLDDVSSGIFDLVNEVNNNISTSYGNIVQICNPFSPPPTYEYQPSNCPVESIRIGDIPRVLRLLTCPDTNGGTCNGGIVVPAGDFNRVEAYTTSVQRLLDVYPGLESLVECGTVRAAFAEILESHCGPLRRYARMAWASLAFLSVVMVVLVLLWAAGAHHVRAQHPLDGSVKPHLVGGLEVGEDGLEHNADV
ncbi:Na(+)/H(+) antiporter NhaB [Striga asiatica]|uniref:Na(+)/H(+) antiporter NhaB n=1 Tax=Striga asiatica TaxID=4170 RepID=A0A5A7P630_STRAF|nr:Na(+)/H(+) antiporter NhaB [Striga asiatica]